MVFKRREKLTFWQRVREFLSPRKGWSRGFRYIGKRVQRLPDTPHRIALGFACGALASFSPFFTLHALVAVIYAYIVRANIWAGIFGTVVGNPFSIGPIAYVSLTTGNWLLGRTDGKSDIGELSFSYVWNNPLEFLESIFTPYLIGGLIPGLICAAAFYFVLRASIARFQNRRRSILAARARGLADSRKRAPRGGGPDGAGGGGHATGPEGRDRADYQGGQDAAERRAAETGATRFIANALPRKRPRSAT